MASPPEASKDILRRLISDQATDHFTYLADAVGNFALGRADLYYVFDVYGNKYLDLSAGDGTMVIGHSHPEVASAVENHLQHHAHTARSGMHVSPKVSQYAKALSATFPKDPEGAPQQVLFCASDIEARLHAVALARAVTGRRTIVSLAGQPPPPSNVADVIVEGTAPDSDRLIDAAAVMCELINFDMSPVEQVWARMLTETAERAGAAVIIDETRTGYGRTGSMWAHEQWGIDPDITILGGAGGGGFPFGAVVSRADLFAAYAPVQRLFGASPVICQAGLITLGKLTPLLLEHVVDAGHLLTDSLTELRNQFPDLIAGHCGIGLAHGLILSTPEAATRFFQDVLAQGLLVRPPIHGRVIPITPPLVTPEGELRRAVDAMASVCLDWTEPL